MNNLDVQAIEKAVAYLDRVSLEQLPILPTGVCVVAGVSAQVPVIVKISPLPPQSEPNSRTMSLTSEWLRPLPPEKLATIRSLIATTMSDRDQHLLGATMIRPSDDEAARCLAIRSRGRRAEAADGTPVRGGRPKVVAQAARHARRLDAGKLWLALAEHGVQRTRPDAGSQERLGFRDQSI